ncbi:UDP-glucose--hexose-1-phosphate uridylyltransferase [Oenococcus alcoholitolerans]|uniref:UDP-glucose--hexose-1-phosphate uridylyltransferase n=1 Tax=Oenococcus alcoholitolerans TaxID=931074 RepID=UPI003F6E5618
MQEDLAGIFADKVIEKKRTYQALDKIYLTNQIYSLVGEKNQQAKDGDEKQDIYAVRDELVRTAVKNQKINDDLTDREILASRLMNFSVPRPSVVNDIFWKKYKESPNEATNYFFSLSKDSDYIKTRAIAKNIAFKTATDYGDLEITINLSKPEKDPKAIAAAGKKTSTSYPLCQLCMENEGYLGRLGYPARSEHRIIRLELNGEQWGFQYSPYAYFNEHAIFLSPVHRPMHIDRITFKNLLTIVKMFPEYTVGSNADLPIVGGSILSHDHYQGGRHDFPMALAAVEKEFELPDFQNVKAGIVKWPMSVIRLWAKNSDDLIPAAGHILDSWKQYSDESVDIRAYTHGQRHHTITPIARKRGENYEIDLVLRDNQTSDKYPDGIFHPHKDVQHIKKENIGLIEVMGLAILPARLKDELAEVEKYVLGQKNQIADYHRPWADQLKAAFTGNEDQVHDYVQQAAGRVFAQVLEYAGVFKSDQKGRSAFDKFIQQL